MVATYSPPLGIVTSTDRGGGLIVVNIITLVLSLVSVGARFHISYDANKNRFVVYKDDLLCCAATVFCILEFALIWAGVSKGNGKFIDSIPPQNLFHIQQMQYAADIFYIASLFCSRASVVFLLERLQSAKSNILWRLALGVLFVSETAFTLMIALKCNLSKPWIEYGVQCTGLLARWEVVEISGIVIEGGIFALAIYLVYGIHMSLTQKMKVVALFGTRAVVVIFAALRISYLPSYFHSQNPTYSGIPATIYALAEMHASLITVTTPLIKPFITQFNVVRQRHIPIIAGVQSTNTEDTKTEVASKSASDDGQLDRALHSDRMQGSEFLRS